MSVDDLSYVPGYRTRGDIELSERELSEKITQIGPKGSRYEMQFDVKSFDRHADPNKPPYVVSKWRGQDIWECSCPHYIYRCKKEGTDCKHITATKRTYANRDFERSVQPTRTVRTEEFDITPKMPEGADPRIWAMQAQIRAEQEAIEQPAATPAPKRRRRKASTPPA